MLRYVKVRVLFISGVKGLRLGRFFLRPSMGPDKPKTNSTHTGRRLAQMHVTKCFIWIQYKHVLLPKTLECFCVLIRRTVVLIKGLSTEHWCGPAAHHQLPRLCSGRWCALQSDARQDRPKAARQIWLQAFPPRRLPNCKRGQEPSILQTGWNEGLCW